MQLTYPLKNNWRIDEDSSVDVQEQIRRRVNAEDTNTWAKNYPILKSEDIQRCKALVTSNK